MEKRQIFRAAVLYNVAIKKYVYLKPETLGGDPIDIEWEWVENANQATHWINMLELEWYLKETPLGDPQINSYPWDIQWMYFI